MPRAFIALELPVEIKRGISRAVLQFQKGLAGSSIRWVLEQNIHLTLKFLGDIPTTSLEKLVETLGKETTLLEPFSMSIKNLGAFPNPRQARIIWVGCEAPAGLEALASTVKRVTTRLGFPDDDRPFSPHLTVGRVRQDRSRDELRQIIAAIEGSSPIFLGSFQVNEVLIFKSDLLPGGPRYSILHRLPLSHA